MIAAAIVAAFITIAFPASVAAQSDLMNSLKGALGKVTGSGEAGTLATDKIVAGLREALKVGTRRVVDQVGAENGFNADPAIHIPLPPDLAKVQDLLRKFGLSSLADEVELKLNRAAEAAAPKTRELLVKAVTDMTIDDARRIHAGPEDAATQYFRRVASDDLRSVIRPVVDDTLAQVGAVDAYDRLMGRWAALPLVPDVKADLSGHATEKTMEGIFHYLAKEEAAIRRDPAKRTTELLRTVFGG